MPKPFPFSLNIGTDICDAVRVLHIVKSYSGKGGLRFASKLLRDDERAENKSRLDVPIQRFMETTRISNIIRWKKTHISKIEGTGRGEELLALKRGTLNDVDILSKITKQNNEGFLHVSEDLKGVARFLAGRFAAKEAVIKAHRSRRLTYHDIVIRKQPDNEHGTQAPIAIILPKDGNWDEGQEAIISISHDGDYATATCLAYEPTSMHQQSDRLQAFQIPHSESCTGNASACNTANEADHLAPSIQKHSPWPVDRVVKVEGVGLDMIDSELEIHFKAFTGMLEASISRTRSGVSEGSGYVLFDTQMEAAEAAAKIDGCTLNGNLVWCERLELSEMHDSTEDYRVVDSCSKKSLVGRLVGQKRASLI